MDKISLRIQNKRQRVELELENSEIRNLRDWASINDQLLSLYDQHPYWIFRGIKNENHRLQTSFERKINDKNLRGIMYSEMLDRFVNAAQSYKANEQIPNDDDKLGIQSLMQHYGCPTILMDWSFSPYVAMYFASEDALDSNKTNGAIYALNALMLWRILEHYFDAKKVLVKNEVSFSDYGSPEIFDKIYNLNYPQKIGFILPVEPKKKNSRIFIQQGIFTYNGNIYHDFEENLALLLDFANRQNIPEYDIENLILRIVVNQNLKSEIQEKLLLMNITASSLFPGLEGFARYWNQYILQKKMRLDNFMSKSNHIQNTKQD